MGARIPQSAVGFVPPQLQSVRSLVDFEHQAVSMLPCFHQQEIRVLRIFGHARPNLKHVQKFSTTVATSNPTIGASADCFSWRCGPEGGSEPHPKSIQSDQITEAVNWAFTEVFFSTQRKHVYRNTAQKCLIDNRDLIHRDSTLKSVFLCQ